VARPNSQDGKTEATLVNIVLLMRFGSATGWPLQYVEEAGGTRLRVGGTRFAGRAVGAHSTTDEFVAGVENLCIVRAEVY